MLMAKHSNDEAVTRSPWGASTRLLLRDSKGARGNTQYLYLPAFAHSATQVFFDRFVDAFYTTHGSCKLEHRHCCYLAMWLHERQ